MGRDKAGILIRGQPLWERQLAILRELRPAELLISGRLDGPYANSGLEIIQDITPERGPLSGLEAALQRAAYPMVLVLAIDLPDMTSEFLARQIWFARQLGWNDRGMVPRANGHLEPLAAIYPRACLPLISRCVRSEDLSMQSFVNRAHAWALLKTFDVLPQDAPLFRNVNTPADLAGDESL